jgi:4-amino-4-deoxy-L-arabinose transferase-like glycosyltransferase
METRGQLGSKKFWVRLISIAVIVKCSVVLFVILSNPQSIMENDSWGYLKTGLMIFEEGKFGVYNEFRHFVPEIYRTPGYPFFLGMLHGFFHIPLTGVIFIQCLMTILTSWLIFQIAQLVNPRVGYFSAFIVLADPPILIYSMMILTESLFLLLVTLLYFSFVLYLRSHEVRWVILSAFLLGLSVLVRPIGYLLGVGIGALILIYGYRDNRKQAIVATSLFLFIVYSLVGLWHLRNYLVAHDATFSSITQATIFSQYATGMVNSFARNNLQQQGLNPIVYYLQAGFESLLGLLTDPGNFKYFDSYSLRIAGKIFGYPWMIFWLIGLLASLVKLRNNAFNQFAGVMILYFIVTSIAGAMLGCGPRFRVPMVPFIAILSAQGWDYLNDKFLKTLRRKKQ